MDFSATTFSTFENATRSHYTLAAREVAGVPLFQLFTVFIAPNGTSGGLTNTVEVKLPAVAPTDLTYLFTYKGSVYAATSAAVVYAIDPTTGAAGNATALLPANSELVDTRAAAFDAASGTFFVNSVGPGGKFLHSLNVGTGALGAPVGPLPPTPTTDAGPGNTREDAAVATLPVYRPADSGGDFRLMELRTSPVFPYLFMAWLDPVSGNSTEIPLPDDWYTAWDIDPEIFPEQWLGSVRRVWDYDSVNNYAFFKLYDECGGNDDCTENESIVCACLRVCLCACMRVRAVLRGFTLFVRLPYRVQIWNGLKGTMLIFMLQWSPLVSAAWCCLMRPPPPHTHTFAHGVHSLTESPPTRTTFTNHCRARTVPIDVDLDGQD